LRRGVEQELRGVLRFAVDVDRDLPGGAVHHAGDVVPAAGLGLLVPGAGAGPDGLLRLLAGDPVGHDELLLVRVVEPQVPSRLREDAVVGVVRRLRPGRNAVGPEPGGERVAALLDLVEVLRVGDLDVSALPSNLIAPPSLPSAKTAAPTTFPLALPVASTAVVLPFSSSSFQCPARSAVGGKGGGTLSKGSKVSGVSARGGSSRLADAGFWAAAAISEPAAPRAGRNEFAASSAPAATTATASALSLAMSIMFIAP